MDKERLAKAGIDLQDMEERFEGHDDIFEKYLWRFKDDKHMQGVREGLAAEDYDKILEEAHAMKGLSGTLCMQQLYLDSSDVVLAVRNAEYDKVSGLIHKMEDSYEKIMNLYV
ncbi:MAG: Hpt domain-containing protein [Lachnospiraceae bacterium]|nr:Hpt domain-containing protein [Lachnospiraceae bacterium]